MLDWIVFIRGRTTLLRQLSFNEILILEIYSHILCNNDINFIT